MPGYFDREDQLITIRKVNNGYVVTLPDLPDPDPTHFDMFEKMKEMAKAVKEVMDEDSEMAELIRESRKVLEESGLVSQESQMTEVLSGSFVFGTFPEVLDFLRRYYESQNPAQ